VYFQISTEKMPTEIIGALTRIKAAYAHMNGQLQLLPQDKAQAAARGVVWAACAGFPLAVWQTWSGTQTT
jgi:fumarate hydratase class II